MLSSQEVAQFTEVCTKIGDEVADEGGFVKIRDLLDRFHASVIVRPLLVEGMLASINERPGSATQSQRWAVLVDSETYRICDADIANESSSRPSRRVFAIRLLTNLPTRWLLGPPSLVSP